MLPLIIGGGVALGSGIANYLEGQDRAKAAAEAYDKIVGLGNAAEAQNAADIAAYKQMNGNLTMKDVPEEIMSVLNMTGLSKRIKME